jgi:hypothetical protein
MHVIRLMFKSNPCCQSIAVSATKTFDTLGSTKYDAATPSITATADTEQNCRTIDLMICPLVYPAALSAPIFVMLSSTLFLILNRITIRLISTINAAKTIIIIEMIEDIIVRANFAFA